jgi:cytochrome c oxidase assembly protein Cox11
MNPNWRKNMRVAAALVVVIGIMASLVSYSPTLYRVFCAATGFGGTTQRAEGDNGAVSDRVITVRFDTNIASGLPWRFEPVQREVKVHLGEEKLIFFSAENLTDQPIVGHATFNVTPEKTGLYFKKIQCFCFDDERLDAHQKVDQCPGRECDHAFVHILSIDGGRQGKRSVPLRRLGRSGPDSGTGAVRRTTRRMSRARSQ